jgi:hypothetical protein
MKLHERVNHVRSKADLVEFVRVLAEGLTTTNREDWENPTLETYLAALARWLEDSDGYYRNQGRPVPAEPSWRDVADMLMAAKMYE